MPFSAISTNRARRIGRAIPSGVLLLVATPALADCSILHVVSTWGLLGKFVGLGLAGMAALHPLSDFILKAALAVGEVPQPWAPLASRILWGIGLLSAAPCLGTPATIRKIHSGELASPLAKGTKHDGPTEPAGPAGK